MALVTAVGKWRHYLEGNHFIIKTDHKSFKFLLEQRITTPPQQKWLSKWLGLDYEICYKKGVENVVADALSRQHELTVMSGVVPSWIKEVMGSYENDTFAQGKITEHLMKNGNVTNFQYKNGLLYMDNRIYIGSGGDIRKKLLIEIHSEWMQLI